jgi:hypothetical protein
MKINAFGQSTTLTISPTIKLLALPAISILLSVLMTVLVITNGFTRLRAQMDALSGARANEEILQQKVDILRSLSSTLLERSDRTLTAVPSQNPVLWYLSTLRQMTSKHSVLIDRINISLAEGKDGPSGQVRIALGIKGEEQNVLDFALELSEITPLTNLSGVEMDDGGGLVEATVNISSAWYGQPESIPAVSESISDLTDSERVLLEKLFNLSQPVFTSLDPSFTGVGRQNPFDKQ